MADKTVLVTGGTGFLGTRIVEDLVQKNYKVKVLTRNKSLYNSSEQIEYIQGDILDKASLSNAITNCTCVVHSAAVKIVADNMYEVNVLGTKNVCDVVNESKVYQFCYISTVSVFGITGEKIIDEKTPLNPSNPYEKTKFEAEKYVLENINESISSVILRPTRIFGKNEVEFLKTLSFKFRRWIKGNESANYVYVKDVAAVVSYFLTNPKIFNKEVFIVNSNDSDNLFKTIFFYANDNKHPFMMYPSLYIPYIIRTLKNGRGNINNKFYNSAKLIKTGFVYPFGLIRGIKDALK